ncbi:hypothetical protein Tco_1159491 [Tanacetum coccineum]
MYVWNLVSRISTFNHAVQLSSNLDVLYTKTVDGVDAEEGPADPIIFEHEEGSEEGGDEVMETDEEDNEELEEVSNVIDLRKWCHG